MRIKCSVELFKMVAGAPVTFAHLFEFRLLLFAELVCIGAAGAEMAA